MVIRFAAIIISPLNSCKKQCHLYANVPTLSWRAATHSMKSSRGESQAGSLSLSLSWSMMDRPIGPSYWYQFEKIRIEFLIVVVGDVLQRDKVHLGVNSCVGRTRTKKLHYGAREIKNPVTEKKKFDYQFYPKIFQSRDLNFSYPGSFLMTTLMLKSKFQNSSFLKSKGIKFESNHC